MYTGSARVDVAKMEFCTITFCVLIFTLKLAASSPFFGDELGRPSGDYQTLGASHNGYVPEGTPVGLTRSQNPNFRSNNAYREPMNPENYGFSRNGYENNNRPQVGSLLSNRQANNGISTLPINVNRNRYSHSSLGEEGSFLNNPSEPVFSSEPFERGNINFNHQPSGLHLSGLPVHNENIRNLEPFRDLQNERIRNIEPMHTVSEPYYNPRQNMFNINAYQHGAQMKNNNIPRNEHVQNVPELLWNNVPLPNRGINKILNLHQLVHPSNFDKGYNVQQLISNPQIKEALQNIGMNSKKRYLVIHADGSVEHTDTLEPTIATNPNSLFLNKEHVILNGNAPTVVTTKPEISSSPTAIDGVGSPSLTANPLEDLVLNNEENENGSVDAKELLDKEIRDGLSENSKKPLKTVKKITHHSVQKTSKNSHHFSSTLKPSPSDDDDEYDESATKAALLNSSIAEYTDEEDDENKPLKTSSGPQKNLRTTTSSTKLSNTEYSVDVESKISTSTTKPPPISTTTRRHNHTHTITPPLTHKTATHLHHHTTAHTFKTSTTKSPSLNDDDGNDDKFRKPLKHSSTKTLTTKTPKMRKNSDKEWDDELKTSKNGKKPTTPKPTTTRKLQHSTTNKYLLRETPTTTEDLSEIYYEDEYEYYLTEKPPTKFHPIKNSKGSKSTTPTFTKRTSRTTRPSKRMSPKHYSSESEENDERSLKKDEESKYNDEDQYNNKRNKHDESYLSIKNNKKSRYDSEDETDDMGNKHNKRNSSINVKRKNMASNKSKTNRKKGKDNEEDFENYDDKKVSFIKKNGTGTCCQQKHVIENLYKEHEDPESLLIYHLNNVTVVGRDTLRTVYPNGTVIEEISDYLVDNNDYKIKIRTEVNIIHPDDYEEEEESDWY